jgi:hypothetical protein
LKLSGHEIGVLKEYMQDLVEQARQEAFSNVFWKYKLDHYNHDDALMDLLMILDDRKESEGLQEGITGQFTHLMWKICDQARMYVKDMVWLSSNAGNALEKTGIREVSYRALIEFIEKECSQK